MKPCDPIGDYLFDTWCKPEKLGRLYPQSVLVTWLSGSFYRDLRGHRELKEKRGPKARDCLDKRYVNVSSEKRKHTIDTRSIPNPGTPPPQGIWHPNYFLHTIYSIILYRPTAEIVTWNWDFILIQLNSNMHILPGLFSTNRLLGNSFDKDITRPGNYFAISRMLRAGLCNQHHVPAREHNSHRWNLRERNQTYVM